MNDRLILHWLEPRDANLVARLGELDSPDAVAEELYLSVFSRVPTSEERSEVSEYLAQFTDRRDAALGDLAWALLSSIEFRLNH
jgi:hypothetical protein